MVYVIVQQGEPIDGALKRFSMKVQQSGVLRDVKEQAHYEKPSEKRRKKQRRRFTRP